MGEAVKGERGRQRSGQRRYRLMDGQGAGWEEENRRRDDGELSFYFPSV